MKFFTELKRTIRMNRNRFAAGLFIQGILYVCVICLLNTLFFAVVQYPVQVDQHLSGTTFSHTTKSVASLNTGNRKFAKSLLRFVVENIFKNKHATNTEDTKDAVHEELHKVEYISIQPVCLFFIPYFQGISGMPVVQDFRTSPSLEMLTPPPKV